MVKKYSLLLLSIILIFGAFLPQGKSVAATGSITISTDLVNVRGGPGLSYPLVKIANRGEKYQIVKEQGDWIQIQLSFGKTGWLVNWLVAKDNDFQQESKPESTATKNNTGIVNGDTLNIRHEPSTSSPVIGKLTGGTSVTIYSKQNNWLEVGFSNVRGWVRSEFIDSQSSSAQNGTTQNEKTASTVTGTVTANSLSVRSEASFNSNPIGTVTYGLSYKIVEEKNNWEKIEYKTGSFGWVAGWYLDKKTVKSQSGQAVKKSIITIIHNGTNIRIDPNVQSGVLERANKGSNYPVKRVINDWYEIKLKNGKTGYVAGWLVSINGTKQQIEKPGAELYLKNKTIVLDPGHGGVDKGATGASGTYEKELTLRTSQLLSNKLKAAGANVYVTRKNDSYLQLAARVNMASNYKADAFISLHYDSNLDRSVRGMTGFYYHSYQKALAESIFTSTIGQTKLINRGVRFGDFHVIRENSQKAVLIELGYLSNPEEEMTIKSSVFQENAASGLFNGLARYFKEND
ncbi:N-acetylmuramoyl-L-alanine amidase [Bacillus sp. ISL-40]|uniref:N-acetylmuramoyl-L-alanine amidase n=1 Tax=unclassified Bacillus (in: firmicutes) TaxID=185979 RepID=UPI001BEBCA4A|nr:MULTISPECIES: N-acetylmuramoyl-L-alanine amidase [unclassified Bacillus (in: firmicutes)]MBT2697941.1 N-acetylmuramoyl-L-alanine amidase [Bacillus sp. ISL-40]MBT2721471.1 N-acetylmuramoyl-L-alanine amidase [Bacillus sp. ISL-46]